MTFSVRASGPPPLRYQWQRNGANIAGATAQDYTLAAVARPTTARASAPSSRNDFGSVAQQRGGADGHGESARRPARSPQPAAGTLYSGGSVISYAGTATDPEDGTLPASAFTWQVDFHHDTHIAPVHRADDRRDERLVHHSDDRETPSQRLVSHLPDGARLRRADADDVQRDVLPRMVALTLATSPPGLQLRLDGQPVATPLIVRQRRRHRPQRSRRPRADVRRHDVRVRVVVRRRRRRAQHLDAGGEHDLHRHLSRQRPAAPARAVGHLLQQHRLHRDDRRRASTRRWTSTGARARRRPRIGADTFSVRWTGQVEAPVHGDLHVLHA